MARTINLETNRVLHHARFARGAFDSAFFSLVLHLRKPFTHPNDRLTSDFGYQKKTLNIFIKVCYSPSRISHPTLARLKAIAVSARQIRKS